MTTRRAFCSGVKVLRELRVPSPSCRVEVLVDGEGESIARGGWGALQEELRCARQLQLLHRHSPRGVAQCAVQQHHGKQAAAMAMTVLTATRTASYVTPKLPPPSLRGAHGDTVCSSRSLSILKATPLKASMNVRLSAVLKPPHYETSSVGWMQQPREATAATHLSRRMKSRALKRLRSALLAGLRM